MKPFNLTLAANETRSVSVSGDYFELRKAPYVLDLVEFLNVDNGVVGLIDEAEATDKTRTKEPFAQVRITNGATAQSIRFYHGFGDSGSNRFTGVVSGEVSLDAATLAALEFLQVRPEARTGFLTTGAAMVANTPETIFTPAANVNGAIILSASLVHYQSGGAVPGPVLISKASAPASPTDGAVYMQPQAISLSGAAYVGAGNLPKEQHVPAGEGLYWISQDALGAAAVNLPNCRACRYRLL